MSTGPTGSDKTDQSRNLLISGPPAPHSALMGSGVLDLCVSASRLVQSSRSDQAILQQLGLLRLLLIRPPL